MKLAEISKQTAPVALSIAMLLAISGCSGSSMESDVSGTVTLDGKGIGPGTIVFAPAENQAVFWRVNYSSVLANPEVVQAAAQLLSVIESLPMVERVDKGWLK